MIPFREGQWMHQRDYSLVVKKAVSSILLHIIAVLLVLLLMLMVVFLIVVIHLVIVNVFLRISLSFPCLIATIPRKAQELPVLDLFSNTPEPVSNTLHREGAKQQS